MIWSLSVCPKPVFMRSDELAVMQSVPYGVSCRVFWHQNLAKSRG